MVPMFTEVFLVGIDTPVLACQECGALVFACQECGALVWFDYRYTHMSWHNLLRMGVVPAA